MSNKNVSLVNRQIKDQGKMSKNATAVGVRKYAEEVKVRHLLALGEYPITVVGINWFPKPDQYNRIGTVTVTVPAGYMEIKVWDNVDRKFVWHEFESYNYDQMKATARRLTAGSGFLTLTITETKDGKVQVRMPKTKGKNSDVYYDVFRTKDVRFGVSHTDNNVNLQAAIMAFLQVLIGEFVQANPMNRNGYSEHCGNCRHNVYLPMHDGLAEEYENKMSSQDVIDTVQYGSRMPQWVCGVYGDFTDVDAIENANEAGAFSITQYTDNEGVVKQLRHDEILIDGAPVKLYNIRKEGTIERCGGCAFYHKNERKPENALASEKMNAKEGQYVSAYWTERADHSRMPIQVLVGSEWVTGNPGEIEEGTEFRIKGIGGVNVYASEEVLAIADMSFVAPVEEYNEVEAKGAKLVNIIHQAANNFDQVDEKTLDAVFGLIENTDKDTLSVPLQRRLDRAVERLAQTIAEYQG